ncbi:hypothetical protein EA860_18405 [Vibrio anguillarum]|nr:hypothetical protein [Vibrio anguillarum]
MFTVCFLSSVVRCQPLSRALCIAGTCCIKVVSGAKLQTHDKYKMLKGAVWQLIQNMLLALNNGTLIVLTSIARCLVFLAKIRWSLPTTQTIHVICEMTMTTLLSKKTKMVTLLLCMKLGIICLHLNLSQLLLVIKS